MSQATELIASQVGSAMSNQKTWGTILYNVKDPQYGAKGDGVVNDTQKVQAAINYAISVGGKAVFFPHGVYYVTALTSADQVVFFGDNSSFTGGYVGTINQLGASYASPNTSLALLSDTNFIRTILDDLENPFKKTQIKLAGDSIMAGAGGTGYSATGDPMFTDTLSVARKTNLYTATCFSNSLRSLILQNYNGKENYIELTNPGLTLHASTSLVEDANTLFNYKLYIPNTTTVNNALTFTFYGDHFSVYTLNGPICGILDVYVDGAKIGSIDTYKSTYENSHLNTFTGLSLASHSVQIRETNTKSPLSTAVTTYIESVRIPKTVIVKNWGIYGINSNYMYYNKNNYFESTDDIVLIEVGVNDRSAVSSTYTRGFLRDTCKYITVTLGAKAILMSSNAVSSSNDNAAANKFKMPDVDAVLRQLAKELNIGFISNYDATLQYCLSNAVLIDSLTVDGLHPNDFGHNVMYQNIARKFCLVH